MDLFMFMQLLSSGILVKKKASGYYGRFCLSILICFVTVGVSSAQKGPEGPNTDICPIIPQPASASLSETGQTFRLDRAVKFKITKSSQSAMVAYFKTRLEALTGTSWASLGQGNGGRTIILKLLPPVRSQEERNNPLDPGQTRITAAYQLQISPDHVLVQSKNEAGLFYGINSLLQLAVQPGSGISAGAINIPCWQIKDQPALSWRGFMLDESRHFFGKEKVKMILDWMAFYKLNYFHWHLTDEPAWRMAIQKYPLLTVIGATGNKTDSTAPAKYYSQDDIREIIAYAKKRYINVIPEIDMPGHATAANRAYPKMSGGGTGKFANFTFNPGLDTTYGFLTDILRETAAMFPAHYLHIGGDEVSFGSKSWSGEPAVRQLMKAHHLEDLKAVEYYFLRRMTDSALKYNDKVLAWDEAVDAGLPAGNTVIFWWRHDQPAQLKKALQEGFDVVMCPRVPLYFDFVQDSLHQVGRKWNKIYASLQQVFDFWPGNYKEINDQNIHHVLGIQANLWTETVQTPKRLDFLLFPRMAALATAAWTLPSKRQYQPFLKKIQAQLPLYQKEGIYFYNPFSPAESPEPRQ